MRSTAQAIPPVATSRRFQMSAGLTPKQSALLARWEKRLAGLAKLAKRPALAEVKVVGKGPDGAILFRAVPGWEIGREHNGTFIPGPARAFTYQLHADGRLCGHGYKDCGCGHGADETTAAQQAWTTEAQGKWVASLKPAQRTARGLRDRKADPKRSAKAKATTVTRKRQRAAKATAQAA